MTDPTRAAAEAALREVHSRWNDDAEGPDGWTEFAPAALDAILANPDHRKALLPVLLDEEELAAALEWLEESSELLYSELAKILVRRLTEPTDTGSGSDG